MPVYLSTKNLLSIPRDDESDISDNELYLEDPEMLFDRLPQPFRFINKIVNKICNDSWTRIIDLTEVKQRELKRQYIDSISAINKLKEEESIQCMCTVAHSQLMTGLKDGIAVWNMEGEEPVLIDRWKVENMNSFSLTTYTFGDNVNLITVINENGSASILAIVLGRIFVIKEYPVVKDSDTPTQITKITLDPCCTTIIISYTQIGGDEHWFEVAKINKEAWVKEIGIVQRGYQTYLNCQSDTSLDESSVMETISSEPLTIPDRNAIKVTQPIVVLKMKFPDSGSATGVGNINQLYKQVDTSGYCIGLGLNHCITKTIIDARIKATLFSDVSPSQVLESCIQRISNVRFLKSSGSLIPETGNDENSDKEYSAIVVWWSHCQHLSFYGLNKPIPKDPWVKPDCVRTFSSPISVCEVSPDNNILSVGLDNGVVVLIDIRSGLTRFVKKISNYSIQTFNFLNYKDSDYNQYINIIDDKHSMYCVTFNTHSYSRDTPVASIDSDVDVDAVVVINPSYDLALSVSRQSPMVLRDLFSGTAILTLELPENSIISCPWQPIIAFVSDKFLCVQVLTKVLPEMEEFTPTTLLYKLELTQFKFEDKVVQSKQGNESVSYITRMADEYLTKRNGSHHSRQNQLLDCFANLSQYTPTSALFAN